MIYMPAEVMPASIFAALHSRAPGQSSTSGTECHTVFVGSRVHLQETFSAGTGSRGVSCLSSLCWTIILAVWCSDSKKTEPCRRVFLKLNRHILLGLNVLWYCRTAEDTLQRLCFWLLPTYLLSVVISRKLVKTKMKMPPKLKLKW